MDTGTPDLLFERRGPVAWVTFNRPESRNAMTFAMYDGLARICDAVEADPEVRVLVLTGAGDKAFVAGTDISQFQTFTEPQHALDYEARIDGVIGRLEALARPTIAMVRGYAVGGGASIALACDLRICTPDARFGIPIARTLGNCLSMNNYSRLVDLIGPARTKEIIFTARMVGAEEAKAIGLVNEIVAPEELEARVTEVAEQIAANAPLTIQVTKESVRRVLAHRRPERSEELILRCYMSEDFREGVRAFLEKRKPQWQGR
ncbi:enoyl-CoA hydratase/isomerase family protein [Sphaerobacter thermophilus]|uniref:Enoyl-CoA hydratase/isomerase n=1 Tax=Sphaerobacter thermophilus (strain ATCC 49802 / DSM 20745 / KCCM 41009 / NCIMB 13125 / S 6022) TaxID=479434 RepID=D1C4Q7_SPHTD|nr:enoyl-CoA hydratase/isomerase family protein [Sphaerobacter thermophilus]ACZ39224.1 Enoyl-CoA hydratase/isomerase [Sphaerobacter thermophilus DSM 20745]